jgi:hypothetical protein
LVTATPYVFTFVKSLWRIFFKKTRNPTIKILIIVSCILK